MSDASLSTDVAKVLRGTHHIRTMEIPEREHELIRHLLETKAPLEDATPGSVIATRYVSFFRRCLVEMEILNPNRDDLPTLLFTLYEFPDEYERVSLDPDEGYPAARQAFHHGVPDEVVFEGHGKEGTDLVVKIRKVPSRIGARK